MPLYHAPEFFRSECDRVLSFNWPFVRMSTHTMYYKYYILYYFCYYIYIIFGLDPIIEAQLNESLADSFHMLGFMASYCRLAQVVP